MKINRVFARFYKSFNFDNVLKATPGAKPRGDWEMFEDVWYPYVEVPIDPRITAVVGANESGKSQLIGAIDKAITGREISPRDLCRYCPFFGVEAGRRYWPHVGLGWSHVTEDESDRLRALVGVTGPRIDTFMLFRLKPEEVVLWLPEPGGWVGYPRPSAEADPVLRDLLPQPLEVDPQAALPSAVPLAWLADQKHRPLGLGRRARADLLDAAGRLGALLTEDPQSLTANAGTLFPILSPIAGAHREAVNKPATPMELQLARELLFDLAQIDARRFGDLSDAIADGHDGYANAITESLNAQLERRLNFQKWWIQDRDFSLRVSAREHEIVFTIRDRTGTEYTFSERSSGLKYFLSYLIQTQAVRRAGARPRILLMDEPDAHLSAEAQQDLLRVFEDLVDADGERPETQVIYVTHSPFLLDKNHAERIRVVEKGRGLDGTRVVHNAAQNHYEPLRSAFGAFVGETAFVASVNLLVEGQSDQIMLVGAARAIRRRHPGVENDTLDLNRLVIVPCYGASQVPYMVYLIRGRDADKPPVVALLDSDEEGDNAVKVMREDEKFRSLIGRRFILQLGELDLMENGGALGGIEDLVPPRLAIDAANAALREADAFRSGEPPLLSLADIDDPDGPGLFERLEALAGKHGKTIGKVAFARALGELAWNCGTDRAGAAAVSLWLDRMRRLFRKLNEVRVAAQMTASRNRLSSLVGARVQIFVTDHPGRATKEQVANLFVEIEAQLDQSNEADAIRLAMHELRRKHHLADDPAMDAPNYAAVLEDIANLRHAFPARRRTPKATDAVLEPPAKPIRASRPKAPTRPAPKTTRRRAAKPSDQAS